MTIYSVYEVCEILGISRRTITKYIKSGELKAVKLGNQIRITKEALEAFLKAMEIRTKVKPIESLKRDKDHE